MEHYPHIPPSGTRRKPRDGRFRAAAIPLKPSANEPSPAHTQVYLVLNWKAVKLLCLFKGYLCMCVCVYVCPFVLACVLIRY